jgi:hypothetical protein
MRMSKMVRCMSNGKLIFATNSSLQAQQVEKFFVDSKRRVQIEAIDSASPLEIQLKRLFQTHASPCFAERRILSHSNDARLNVQIGYTLDGDQIHYIDNPLEGEITQPQGVSQIPTDLIFAPKGGKLLPTLTPCAGRCQYACAYSLGYHGKTLAQLGEHVGVQNAGYLKLADKFRCAAFCNVLRHTTHCTSVCTRGVDVAERTSSKESWNHMFSLLR